MAEVVGDCGVLSVVKMTHGGRRGGTRNRLQSAAIGNALQASWRWMQVFGNSARKYWRPGVREKCAQGSDNQELGRLTQCPAKCLANLMKCSLRTFVETGFRRYSGKQGYAIVLKATKGRWEEIM